MARFLLLNRVLFDGVELKAGKEIDDTNVDVARVIASGGVVVALPNATLEARAAEVRQQMGRGRREAELDLLTAAFAEFAFGATAAILVRDEGVMLGPFTALDFVGGGVTAANAGAGVASITVPSGVPATRTLTGGAGMTGGGDLSADRAFDVGAHADGSIVVGADTVQVGVLATDAQHGVRGGGTQHAVATTLVAGFMSAPDKVKLDGVPASIVPTTRTLTAGAGMTGGGDLSADRTFDVAANADGSIVANANDIQVGVLASDAQHGVRGGGTQHAVATTLVAGFLSAADKTKLDGLSAGAGSSVLTWGNDSVAATTTTRYLTIGYGESTARTSVFQYRVPRAGTFINARVRQGTGAGNGNAIVYTLRVNGVASAQSVSIASTANDAGPDTDAVVVAAGDLVDVETTKALSIAASPSDIVFSVEYRG